MFAVMKTGGKQYRVQPGDVLRVDREELTERLARIAQAEPVGAEHQIRHIDPRGEKVRERRHPVAGGNGTVPFASSGNATIRPFYIANKISTNASGQLADPYGNAYQYLIPGTKNPASFDIWSKGKDRASTTDDIGNW